jgi:anti-sigma factor (TIGR02949 family)
MNHQDDHNHCIDLAERLSEYLDGELPPGLRDQVQTHFDGCSRCARFLDSLARVRDLAHHLPGDIPSPERLKELAEEARSRLSD